LSIISILFFSGCSDVSVNKHETKYVRTRGSLCDLYVKLDGEWVKFYEDIGDYSLIESPDNRYLLITDSRGCYEIYVKTYDIQDRKLYDLTKHLQKRLPSLSDRVLFVAHRFVDKSTVEFGMEFLPQTEEEKPIVKALNRTTFRADIDDLLVGERYR
jgi:hypothetical protein